MSYCFRIRFIMGPGHTIEVGEPEWLLNDSTDRRSVVLKSLDGATAISDSPTLVLRGAEYSSEEAARLAGERWLSALQAGFARLTIGADFGDRAPKSALTTSRIRLITANTGASVLNDEHGLMVFECDPPLRFISLGTPSLSIGRARGRAATAIEFAIDNGVLLTAQQQLAYDLFSGSFFQHGADARFIMLMMAVETLIVIEPRSTQARDHVSQLITVTRRSDLDQPEIQSLLGGLRWLLDKSISHAGQRLARTLGARTYMEEELDKFFTRCTRYAANSSTASTLARRGPP